MNYLKFVVLMIFAIAFIPSAFAANWPQWRGPTADGICAEKNLPVSWSATENIAWKTPLKGKGESTPIIWGDRIFLTYQTGQNPSSKGPTNGGLDQDPFPNDATLDIHLFVAGFEKSSGKLLWEHEVKTDNVIGTHRKHNMATPSCTTDGERVYAWFGSGQLGCYDFDGRVIWERDLSQEYGPFVIIWGNGSSPVLYGDGLILLCDHARTPYILAVDKKTGKNLWKTERTKGVRSYSTPYFVKVGDKDQMIVNTAGEVEGLDPANGSIIWNAKGILVAPVPSPVASGDLLFTYGGYDSGPIMALKLGGTGDVTDSNVIWKKQKGGPYVPSLVYDGKYLYMINDKGVGTCFEGTTGNEIWKERVGGNFSTSPVMADGKLYVTSEEGETVVLEAAPEFKVVSRNVLDEYTLGSIAVSDGKLYMRTDKTLFCIGK